MTILVRGSPIGPITLSILPIVSPLPSLTRCPNRGTVPSNVAKTDPS
ncbi:MAG TPA: hypothetical protein QF555_05000 [Candidatus Thalassarchaeaceae archaeon]|nr:hypothetical protein [Candidatus Thalassarchaeaceae archaeon]